MISRTLESGLGMRYVRHRTELNQYYHDIMGFAMEIPRDLDSARARPFRCLWGES